MYISTCVHQYMYITITHLTYKMRHVGDVDANLGASIRQCPHAQGVIHIRTACNPSPPSRAVQNRTHATLTLVTHRHTQFICAAFCGASWWTGGAGPWCHPRAVVPSQARGTIPGPWYHPRAVVPYGRKEGRNRGLLRPPTSDTSPYA